MKSIWDERNAGLLALESKVSRLEAFIRANMALDIDSDGGLPNL
jgi:hypothetical protein